MKTIYMASFCAVIVSGCSLGIVSVAPDTYVISDPGIWSWNTVSDLKSAIDNQATEFCAEQGRRMMPVPINQNDGDYSRFTHAELRFRCVAKDPPDPGRSTVRAHT